MAPPNALIRRVPVGPVLAITPFNFPLNLVAHKLAPAIAAGCPVVLKPASDTPLVALAFAALLFIGRPVLLAISNVSARPRPDDVEILASWAGFAFPSIPIAGLTFTVVGLAHAFVVAGKARTVALFSAALVAGLVSLARIYLAVDRLTDVAAAAILATAATILLFRLWAPDDAFPITYTRHKTAWRRST